MSNPPTTPRELEDLLEPHGASAVERLDHWAAATPDRTCLYYGEDETTVTFGEFGAATDSIAGNLAGLGVAPGARVCVFTTNSKLAALAMFGIWKAGAVYSPINFSYTGRLLTYQINDTAPAAVITDAGLLGELTAVAGELSGQPAVFAAGTPVGSVRPWADLTVPSNRPAVEISFDTPANVVYTSGTTGPAKGVLQPHRWMAQYTFGLRAVLTSDDVIYSDLPMYHVGGAIANFVRGVWVGCEVALWDRFSPSEFWDRIARRGATTAILLDVMIPWLMKAPRTAADRENTLNKVYMQPLPLQHAEVADRFGFDFVTAGFGQTETGAPLAVLLEETAEGRGTPAALYRGLSHGQLRAAAARAGMPVLAGADITRKGVMGSPSPFMEVTVLDEQDRECEAQVPGQLALRPRLPALVMTEYLGKPEATAAAWRNLWLHTGDAAVRGADGIFYFVDRMGDRIRVRGENLSSFQVEDLINAHPSVQFSAVFAIASTEGDEDDVVACVVPVDGAPLTAEQIHEYARETMPKFMRPRIVRILEDLPRTPTNKIEKYKLRRRVTAELHERP